jgi:hypothetical protein
MTIDMFVDGQSAIWRILGRMSLLLNKNETPFQIKSGLSLRSIRPQLDPDLLKRSSIFVGLNCQSQMSPTNKPYKRASSQLRKMSPPFRARWALCSRQMRPLLDPNLFN